MRGDTHEPVIRQLEIEADLDRRGIEEVRLRLTDLAKRHGLEVKTVTLTRLPSQPPTSSEG
jgi:hypothetical protein